MRKLILLACLISTTSLAGGTYVRIPAGEFQSVLKYEDNKGKQKMAAFEMMKQPVTNAEFLAFVQKNPQWQRGKAPKVFAEPTHYLSHWQTPVIPGAKVKLQQPVTQVSWFAASAFCEAQGARLPTWNEWEYTAAADRTRRDARSDPAWRESILSWYSKPSNTPIADVGKTPANVYGVQDLNGLVWEWTEDYSAMLVSADNRNQSDPDKSKFCGASALSMEDKENYAVMMRVAMLSSLEAVNSTSNLGFRCAKSLP